MSPSRRLAESYPTLATVAERAGVSRPVAQRWRRGPYDLIVQATGTHRSDPIREEDR